MAEYGPWITPPVNGNAPARGATSWRYGTTYAATWDDARARVGTANSGGYATWDAQNAVTTLGSFSGYSSLSAGRHRSPYTGSNAVSWTGGIVYWDLRIPDAYDEPNILMPPGVTGVDWSMVAGHSVSDWSLTFWVTAPFGGVSGTCSYDVREVPVERLTVDPDTLVMTAPFFSPDELGAMRLLWRFTVQAGSTAYTPQFDQGSQYATVPATRTGYAMAVVPTGVVDSTSLLTAASWNPTYADVTNGIDLHYGIGPGVAGIQYQPRDYRFLYPTHAPGLLHTVQPENAAFFPYTDAPKTGGVGLRTDYDYRPLHDSAPTVVQGWCEFL